MVLNGKYFFDVVLRRKRVYDGFSSGYTSSIGLLVWFNFNRFISIRFGTIMSSSDDLQFIAFTISVVRGGVLKIEIRRMDDELRNSHKPWVEF